jgi:predicted component of type VI protein secretion system
LGRGHECEIRISDISVSRNHASIKFSNGGFHIFDNKSKFGTLVRTENPFDLEVGLDERGVQIGRTFVQMQVKERN